MKTAYFFWLSLDEPSLRKISILASSLEYCISVHFWGCFLVSRKQLLVHLCFVVWILLFCVFEIFCITSLILVNATVSNTKKLPVFERMNAIGNVNATSFIHICFFDYHIMFAFIQGIVKRKIQQINYSL